MHPQQNATRRDLHQAESPGRNGGRDMGAILKHVTVIASSCGRGSQAQAGRRCQDYCRIWQMGPNASRSCVVEVLQGSSLRSPGAHRRGSGCMSGHPAVQKSLRNHVFDPLGLPRILHCALKLNPVEPPRYASRMPGGWEGRRCEASPYPNSQYGLRGGSLLAPQFVYFLFPTSSSHLSPSCFLSSSTFLDASASLASNAARARAYSASDSSKVVMKGHPPELIWGAA